jgi:uracil-DNA glycosylase
VSGALDRLLQEVRTCRVCEAQLPFEPKPVLRAGRTARLLIVGQAPGTRVHQSGIPWNDPSGNRLREWLRIDRDLFYNERRIAIIPMGFCYPGKGASGDRPPRPECAPLWHERLLAQLPGLRLRVLVGKYAQDYYLGTRRQSLAETVRAFEDYLPEYFPLPHPSPRNMRWFRNHPWFELEVVPALRALIAEILK